MQRKADENKRHIEQKRKERKEREKKEEKKKKILPGETSF
jgi:hypothetical protein